MINKEDILYEDNHLIAVQKRAGVPVQGDETGDTPLVDMVMEYIRQKYQKPGNVYVGLLHRLDRPVAGLVLFAKTSKAAARMSEMFRDKTIAKTYLAIVERKPPIPADTLTDYIWKDKKDNKVYCYKKEKKESKWAQLEYKQIASADNLYLLEVNPLTGRPHQIRAQLSNIGCSIVGDTKYGSRLPLRDRTICLLAWKLKFIHPVSKEPVVIKSKVPSGKFWLKFELEINEKN